MGSQNVRRAGSATGTAPNAFKVEAQRNKAIAISDIIWAECSPIERRSTNTLLWMRSASPAQRKEYAERAGQKVASDDSWDQVTARIAVMIQRERGLTARSRPYAGNDMKAGRSSTPASMAS